MLYTKLRFMLKYPCIEKCLEPFLIKHFFIFLHDYHEPFKSLTFLCSTPNNKVAVDNSK